MGLLLPDGTVNPNFHDFAGCISKSEHKMWYCLCTSNVRYCSSVRNCNSVGMCVSDRWRRVIDDTVHRYVVV